MWTAVTNKNNPENLLILLKENKKRRRKLERVVDGCWKFGGGYIEQSYNININNALKYNIKIKYKIKKICVEDKA